MSKRVKIILNPCADQGHGVRKGEVIRAEGEKWGGLDLVVSEHRGHAFELAREAARQDYEVIVAAGGDGTIHDVINGMLEAGGEPRKKLGVIPIGSGNDFAFAMNIANDIPQAVETAFGNGCRVIDLAQVEDDRGFRKIFVNNLGVGFDANVVIRVESIRKLHGFPKYLWGVLKTLALDFRPYCFEMRFDEETLTEDILFVAFGIGNRHGGGFLLTPAASHEDDKVDTCAVRPMSRLQALRFLNSAVQGTHTRNPLVSMRQSQQVEIFCKTPLPVHIDGEVFSFPEDNVHKLTVTSLPAALDVVVQATADQAY